MAFVEALLIGSAVMIVVIGLVAWGFYEVSKRIY